MRKREAGLDTEQIRSRYGWSTRIGAWSASGFERHEDPTKVEAGVRRAHAAGEPRMATTPSAIARRAQVDSPQRPAVLAACPRTPPPLIAPTSYAVRRALTQRD